MCSCAHLLYYRINGLTHLNLTKLDVLSDLAEIKIGVAYEADGRTYTSAVPADLDILEKVLPTVDKACTANSSLRLKYA